ncbi:MAG: phytanoyl-CoA dioxygenase family protein [Acidobacteria bacterium]|nr:phytanoyl-CoA dioxygenase family protein [Acidobacteriota bacterium]MBI3423285.1 phytanoyl-CoA dioxygenase family protein [Acidobacteriota bacterium]
MLSEFEKQQLDEAGLLVLNNFMSAERCAALHQRLAEIFAALGARAGAEFKQEPQTDRLANLVEHGELFERAIAEPKVLAAVAHVLGPDFKLSSLNARSPRPQSDWVQPLHCDTGALPDERGNKVCNVIWFLDDFTGENGAPRFVPGSHRAGRLPQDVLADASAPHPDEVLVLGKAGTLAVMNAHIWHGGTANRTAQPRLAMHSFYCRRDQPQQQYQKRLLSGAAQQRLTPELRQLLALDDPLNDELSSQSSGRSGFLR